MNWKQLRLQVLERDNYRCKECGQVIKSLDVHHKIPKSKGGLDILENLISLCRKCHRVEEFRDYVSEGRKNINISEELHAELNKLGVRGESFDDIIRKCVQVYKKVNKL